MAKRESAPLVSTAPRAIASLGDALRAQGIQVGREQPVRPAATGELDLSRSAKVVVRRERKGHGGKTVTVVEGLALTPAHLESLAQRMRKALGCGSWVDAGRVLLQGDRAPGAEAWLRANGARLVVRGN